MENSQDSINQQQVPEPKIQVAQPKVVALRKRTQISKAKKTMFLWVAGASVLVGFALVISVFLVQMLVFNEKVLAEKNSTVKILKSNISNVDKLKSEVRALDSNQALISAKANSDDETLQVILDALPSLANSSALAASIQQKLLSGIDGLVINSLQPDLVVGIESLSENSIGNASANNSETQGIITFRFSVSGSYESLKKVLLNLEKSIRTIDIVSFSIESQGDKQGLNVKARAYYEPERIVELKDKIIKR